jgi:hypothetical protein
MLTSAFFALGCALADSSKSASPPASAQLIYKTSFTQFAREIEKTDTSIRSGRWPFVELFGIEDLKEMQKFAKPGDDVFIFEDTHIETTYYSVVRNGHTLKTFTVHGLNPRA